MKLAGGPGVLDEPGELAGSLLWRDAIEDRSATIGPPWDEVVLSKYLANCDALREISIHHLVQRPLPTFLILLLLDVPLNLPCWCGKTPPRTKQPVGPPTGLQRAISLDVVLAHFLVGADPQEAERACLLAPRAKERALCSIDGLIPMTNDGGRYPGDRRRAAG